MTKIAKISRHILLICAFAACFYVLLLASPLVSAACGGVDTSLINCDAGESNNSMWAMLLIIINFLAAGVGILCVGGIIFAGLTYASSNGDAAKVTKAKDMLRNTIIGLLLFIFMYAFLQYIIPGGFMRILLNPPKVDPDQSEISAPRNDEGGNGRPDNDNREQRACYTVGATNASQGRYFHVSGNQSYAFENSPNGIRYAAENDYKSIDLDIWVTKDGVPVATHTGRPLGGERIFRGFHDTAGKIKDVDTRIGSMTFEEVQRLQHVDGFKIYSLEYLITILKETNMNLSLEIKSPTAVSRKLPEIADLLNKSRIPTTVKGSLTLPGMDGALTHARKLGFWTRGTLGTQGWRAANPDSRLCRGFED